jgi:hypothetical protein
VALTSAENYHTDRAEQLSLLSSEEQAKLLRLFTSWLLREGEIPSPETAGARRVRRPASGAIQDKLPGF